LARKGNREFIFRVEWAVPLPFEGGEEAEVLGENP
jgi:hypothetical protein